MGDVHVDEPHRIATDLLPGFEAFTDAHDRRQRLNFKVDVDLATAEVVHDQNVVALIRQVHRTGPATEAVTAEDKYFQPFQKSQNKVYCINVNR